MRGAQALPLLHHCLADMRAPDDLALRSAAANALARALAAAAAASDPAEGATPKTLRP